jgi:Concanavalin A-like lectin/glucanases superfamily
MPLVRSDPGTGRPQGFGVWLACGVLANLAVGWSVAAAPPAPPLHLAFESLDGKVRGHGWLVAGVTGQGLELDGIAAHVVIPASDAPKLTGSFTVEGWVALGAYPFNDAPLLQQQDGPNAGFFLGVGDRGQVLFDVATGGRKVRLESAARLALRQWAHLVGVFEAGKGASLYVNGERAGFVAIEGSFTAAAADLWIGRNAYEMEQSAAVGTDRQQRTRIVLDGILDELRIIPAAMAGPEIAARYARLKPTSPPPLEARSLPRLPPGTGSFGAFYTRLRYYQGWDETWRVGDEADVVVRFDQAPFWLAFWRGTSYIPHWVTENGIWYDNEFMETFPPGMVGSAEPMSDKQCRFSQVRILESSEARAVVHWRYASVGVGYLPAYPDPLTDWADWTDEIHTIYPDGVGVRKIVVHTSEPEARREWHEGIVVMGPGMTPNDALLKSGLVLANSRGESVEVSWEKGTPPSVPPQPARSGIQRINTRSRFRPFAIARSQDDPSFDVYSGEVRRDVSIYPWWNHWPTAFEPSNGRYALAADRASHSSLTHMRWNELARTRDTLTKIHLEGLTEGGVAELASLARSWESPAPLTLAGAGFSGGDYDPGERAWIVTSTSASAREPLALTLAASPDSPLENLAVVVKGWGDGDASLVVDGREVSRGPRFRIGHRQRLEATDLIVFLAIRATAPVRLVLTPR